MVDQLFLHSGLWLENRCHLPRSRSQFECDRRVEQPDIHPGLGCRHWTRDGRSHCKTVDRRPRSQTGMAFLPVQKFDQKYLKRKMFIIEFQPLT